MYQEPNGSAAFINRVKTEVFNSIFSIAGVAHRFLVVWVCFFTTEWLVLIGGVCIVVI